MFKGNKTFTYMKYVKLYSKKYTFQIVVVDASGRKGCEYVIYSRMVGHGKGLHGSDS